jgi:hypothetical protein
MVYERPLRGHAARRSAGFLDLAQPMTGWSRSFSKVFLMTGWARWLFCRHPPRTLR